MKVLYDVKKSQNRAPRTYGNLPLNPSNRPVPTAVVETTQCTRVSHTLIEHTPHGIVKHIVVKRLD